MRQIALLSGVLIGLTVLPLYNSSKTVCDFDWESHHMYRRYEREIDRYSSLLTRYENISSFDLKTADIWVGCEAMRKIINFLDIPYRSSAHYQHSIYISRFNEGPMTLQEMFKTISAEIRMNVRDESAECPWLNQRREHKSLPSEFHLENRIINLAAPLFNKLFRFISHSPSKKSLTQNPVTKNLFKDENSMQQLTDLFDLVELQVKTPTKETKMLLKIAVNKLISNHLTTEAINTLACYIKKLDNNIFLQLIGVSKIVFHDFVDKLALDSHQIIGKHGLAPYKELAYTLVEELELINIHDVTFNLYSIIMNAVGAIEEMNWNENIEKVLDAVAPFLHTMENFVDEIFCHKWPGIEKNMVQMLENLESDSLIGFLQSLAPRVIRGIEYGTKHIAFFFDFHYRVPFHRMKNLVFNISQDSVDLPVTAYLKTNRGAINQLFTHKISVLDMEKFFSIPFDLMAYDYDLFIHDFDMITRSLGIWIDEKEFPLFKNVSFSNEDSEAILQPLRQFYAALKSVEAAASDFFLCKENLKNDVYQQC